MKAKKLNITQTLITAALFLLISTAAWASSPAIFYSDLTAGPNTGGQNNNGIFVTIWGNNFGTAQGSSTITVGGGLVNNYPTWTNTMICFQLGSNAKTGNIVLNTSSGNATGPSFTVQAGNIYFVQPAASTNGTGAYTSPFNHLYYAEQKVTAGDTVYVEAGTITDEINGHAGWHTILMPESVGTQGSPISWIAYPNATVTLKADGGTATWTDGSSGGSDNAEYIFRGGNNNPWQTISKFNLVFTGSNANLTSVIDDGGQAGWKVVGNNVTSSYYTYCQLCTGGDNSSVIGNEIHDSGTGQPFNNENHSIYWGGGGNNVEIGWNYLHGNIHSGWEISCFHQGTRVGKIHDNLIMATTAGDVKGILLGDVDSGEDQTTEEASVYDVYNNVLVNLGQYENGGALQAIDGTAYIYNNTIYYNGLENEGAVQFPAGGIGPGGGHPVWYVANNIIYSSLPSSLYLSDSNGNAPTWSNFALLTNNNYYGAGNGPSQDSHPINANPLFVSAGTNFQLQATSPDINAGYNTLSIVAEDLNGLIRDSAPAIGAYEYTSSSSSSSNSSGSSSSPVVDITSPSSGISLTVGSNLTVTTTASEANGTISNISLYNGSTLLGSSSSSLYNYLMSNLGIGVYTLTAKATDAKGVSTTSNPVTIIVIALPILPSSPVVNITNPANGNSYTAGSNVTITTTASETNGTIKNISLYNGAGLLLGSSSTSPYNFVDSNMAAGDYSFYAVATDASGVSTTSSTITITVTALSVPIVAITSPGSGSNFTAGSTATLTANASEANGTIAQVQFYSAATLLGTDTASPYNFTWNNLPAGNYSITAKATDMKGVSTTSSPVSMSVTSSGTVPPTVSITSPANGSSFIAGSTVALTASASETNGTIAQVQFYSASTLLGTDTASPYNFTWSNLPAGNYSITAKATDTNGVSTTSSPVSMSVTASEVVPPTVSITSPANGSSITAGSNLSITANASETNGTISGVYFYNGTTFLGSDSAAPYNYTWTNIPAGSYNLIAVAIDANGVSTTSSSTSITVTTPSVPPTVSITSPANGSSFTAGSTVALTASASETNGTIAQVQFYNGSTLLGTDTTSSYSFNWTNVPAGSYSLTAKATDTKGVSTTSSAVTITVTAPAVPPTVSITSPANGSSFTAGSRITITASASETNGTISKVQFYNGSTLLGTDTTSSYSFSWTNVPAGSYPLTAKATDSKGVTTTSSTVTITVKAPVSLPIVAITSPANGSSITPGSSPTITVNASETNGTIAQVQIYNGTTLLYSTTTSPYSYTWRTPLPGAYTLTAQAIDSNGVIVTSTPVNVNISF